MGVLGEVTKFHVSGVTHEDNIAEPRVVLSEWIPGLYVLGGAGNSTHGCQCKIDSPSRLRDLNRY